MDNEAGGVDNDVDSDDVSDFKNVYTFDDVDEDVDGDDGDHGNVDDAFLVVNMHGNGVDDGDDVADSSAHDNVAIIRDVVGA